MVAELLGQLDRIAQATTVKEVWKAAADFITPFGFGRLNYGFTRFRHNRNIGNPDDALFLTTASPEYVQHYFNNGFYARTPLYRWALENTGVTNWRWVYAALQAGSLAADEIEALRQNQRFGVTAGMTISFAEHSHRAKAALGLIADPGLTLDDVDRIWTERGAAIVAVANMMHLKITQLPLASPRRALTARQREALEWVADGKTTVDIALLMGISPAMVEKHLRLAREALEVETSAQAVAKGALLNMIFQSPSAA